MRHRNLRRRLDLGVAVRSKPRQRRHGDGKTGHGASDAGPPTRAGPAIFSRIWKR